MYEKFTDRARKVVQLANREAQRFNHEYMGTEHILLGLLKEGSGVGAAALKALGLDLRKIRVEIEKLVQAGPDMVALVSRLPMTPRCRKLLEQSIEEANALGHSYVGTEHLAIALTRDTEHVAYKVLTELGVTAERLETAVKELLGCAAPVVEHLATKDDLNKHIADRIAVAVALLNIPDGAVLDGIDVKVRYSTQSQA